MSPFWHKVSTLNDLKPDTYLYRTRVMGSAGKMTLYIVQNIKEEKVKLLKISVDSEKPQWYSLNELRDLGFFQESELEEE